MNVNPIVTWVLRSPLHRVLSRSTMLVTYQGRKSGRQITLPVNYVREGEQAVDAQRGETPAGGATSAAREPATLRLQGRDVAVQGEVVEDEEELLAGLAVFIKGMPQLAALPEDLVR